MFLVTTGAWFHVAATWENTTGSALDCKMYINGVAVSVTQNNNENYGPGFTPGYSSQPLYIARDESPVGYFEGLIDEVMVFNRALTAEEITVMHSAGSLGVCKP